RRGSTTIATRVPMSRKSSGHGATTLERRAKSPARQFKTISSVKRPKHERGHENAGTETRLTERPQAAKTPRDDRRLPCGAPRRVRRWLFHTVGGERRGS